MPNRTREYLAALQRLRQATEQRLQAIHLANATSCTTAAM